MRYEGVKKEVFHFHAAPFGIRSPMYSLWASWGAEFSPNTCIHALNTCIHWICIHFGLCIHGEYMYSLPQPPYCGSRVRSHGRGATAAASWATYWTASWLRSRSGDWSPSRKLWATQSRGAACWDVSVQNTFAKLFLRNLRCYGIWSKSKKAKLW